MKAFEAETKVGLLATVNPQGLPHITLITTQRAKSPTQHIWGQFSEGQSKKNVQQNPNTSFLILTLDRGLWRGKARWTHSSKDGEDYEQFNNLPMFRYNAYFGIHTVHYMDLVETYGRERLPIVHILVASLATTLAGSAAKRGNGERILKPWAESFLKLPTVVKFLSYVGDDGFPVIIPIVQGRASDSGRVVFSDGAYKKELSRLEKGKQVAVFSLGYRMEDVLVRGPFMGFDKYRGVRLGVIDIDWVYNSMPPVPGQIYPMEDLQPVESF